VEEEEEEEEEEEGVEVLFDSYLTEVVRTVSFHFNVVRRIKISQMEQPVVVVVVIFCQRLVVMQ